MKRISYHISRIGLGITFLWIGVLIFKDPVGWGFYVQPWALRFLPAPLAQIMMGTAVLDAAIGIFLLINRFVWIASLIGFFHVVSVLVVSGITDITVRDIAISYCALALTIDALPEAIANRFSFLK